MKLTVFQSDKGDCLLLTSKDGKRVLVDGGMEASYREHVAPALGRLAKAGHELDLVYVSHIDEDHIAGVLALMSDLVAWRVYKFQRDSGNSKVKPPPRPPDVKRLWHNPFSAQAGNNVGEIESVLQASASVLEAGATAGVRAEAALRCELATSVKQAIELSSRARPEQLGIAVNGEFAKKRIVVGGGDDQKSLGSLRFTVLGPFEADLKKLRDEWNAWLRENGKQLDQLKDKMAGDVKKLANADLKGFRTGLAEDAGELHTATAGPEAKRSAVTAPNLASLMFLVEEGDKTILLTGDGHQDEVLRGLQEAGRLDADGNIHVNVLKIQHHGSKNNIDATFCRRVTADHYVYCGNGHHGNPHPDRVQALIDSRLGDAAAVRAPNPAAAGTFKLWFNSSAAATPLADDKAHMRALEKAVRARERRSDGRMTATFLSGASSFDVRPL